MSYSSAKKGDLLVANHFEVVKLIQEKPFNHRSVK